MDVKCAFLYGTIEEEVYVCQPPRFEDPENPDKVYKVIKALYGLHQAPRAWYETLATYLLENGFQRGTIDQSVFIKKQQKDILLVQIYVDGIIFGATNKALCQSFEKLMKDKLQMSSMGELTFFLGKLASTPIDAEKPLLKDSDGEDVDVHTYRSMIGSLMYLTSSRPDIMFAVCACAQFQVTRKVSHLNAVKRIFRYLKGKPYLGLWYPKDSPFDLVAYSDSDYASASLDRKSTTVGCEFFGCRLISWQCKKQTVVATSSIEPEYVAAASGCAQVLWIQNQLLDYRYNFMHTGVYVEIVVTAASQVSDASATISAAKPSILIAALTVVAAYTRRRNGVIIRDPEEELSSKTPAETPKLKDKGKEINRDHEEIKKDIDWDAAIDHVNQKSKNPQYITRYQGMKKRPQTESEARKNTMIYLKNTAGYKMDFFKGMSYAEICLIFQARFDENMRFLFKLREEMEEKDQEIIKSINETSAQKAAKRRKLSEEAQETEDHRKRLEVVDDEDDDVFIEATPLARKVPVMDYQIVLIDNKPRFKIIKADETHQLYISFTTLLKNFDKEDLENLWGIVKKRFSTSKPTNFSDEYLLLTLKTMFEKPDEQDAVWKSQRSVHGLALKISTFKVHTGTIVGLVATVLIHVAVLVDTAALGELCLVVLTGTLPEFVITAVGTKFLLG
uniref:Putative ribonuclease H-like domain-containing protein n=1 Tax=Tanacetum cinerariifolium TaxID=118510 RepID=A0A699IL51_TANCI|nr:putative ribonuclease H-like domain-containing protein [Tanacetum cinerariifolium]